MWNCIEDWKFKTHYEGRVAEMEIPIAMSLLES